MKTGIFAGLALLATAPWAFAQDEAAASKRQTICPVMGREIDKNIYADYDGKRVYLCCRACLKTFEKDPERYMQKLRAEGIALEDAPESGHEHARHGHLEWADLAKPMGITTFSLLAITASLGLLMKRKPRVLRKWHHRAAALTLISAACHATLVILFH